MSSMALKIYLKFAPMGRSPRVLGMQTEVTLLSYHTSMLPPAWLTDFALPVHQVPSASWGLHQVSRRLGTNSARTRGFTHVAKRRSATIEHGLLPLRVPLRGQTRPPFHQRAGVD